MGPQTQIDAVLDALGGSDTPSRLFDICTRVVRATEPVVIHAGATEDAVHAFAGLVNHYIVTPAREVSPTAVAVPRFIGCGKDSINAADAARCWALEALDEYRYARGAPPARERLEEHVVALSYYYKYAAMADEFFLQHARRDILRKWFRWSWAPGRPEPGLPIGPLLELLEKAATYYSAIEWSHGSIERQIRAIFDATGTGSASRMLDACERVVRATEPIAMCHRAGDDAVAVAARLVRDYITMPGWEIDPGTAPTPGIMGIPDGATNARDAAASWAGSMFLEYFNEDSPPTRDRFDEHLVALSYQYKYCAAENKFFPQRALTDFFNKWDSWSRDAGHPANGLPLAPMLGALEDAAGRSALISDDEP